MVVVAHLRDWIWGQDGRDEDGVQMHNDGRLERPAHHRGMFRHSKDGGCTILGCLGRAGQAHVASGRGRQR